MWFLLGLFIMVSYFILQKTLERAKYSKMDWHCQRCLRHHNNSRCCQLCGTEYGWKIGDKVDE